MMTTIDEMKKLCDEATEFLDTRLDWLETERRNGDYKHLTARFEECQYIRGRLYRLFDAFDSLGVE